MFDEENLNKWFDSEDRCLDTCREDEVYYVGSLDIEDFLDYLREYETDMVCLECKLDSGGIWFNKENLNNASYL